MISNDARPLAGDGATSQVRPTVLRAAIARWFTHLWVSGRLLLLADLLILGGVALLVRLIGFTRQSLWLDEAFSVFLASHRYPQIISFTTSSDAHPPLYYLLLHIWMAFFGPSASAVRALSLLMSVAVALLVYLLGRAVASRRVGLLAAAFMALSSFEVWYAQEARMYAFTAFATTLALYGLIRALRDRRPVYWAIYAAGMLLGMYLDYSAFYVLLAGIIWFWLIGRHQTEVILPFLAATIAVIVGYLPWLPLMLRQIQAVGGLTAWVADAYGTGLLSTLTDFFFNQTNLSLATGSLMALSLRGFSVLLTAFALFAPRRNAWYPLLAIWVTCPLGLGLITEFFNHPITIARTMMVAQPALLLLLALAVDTQIPRLPATLGESINLAVVGLALLALLAGNVSALVTADTQTIKEDWRGAAALVAAQRQPGDLIAFNSYFTQMPFDYYFHQQAQGMDDAVAERGYVLQESLLYANLAPSGQGIQSASEFERYGRVWLIVSHVPAQGVATPPELMAHYHLIGQRQLVGVTVLLFLKST